MGGRFSHQNLFGKGKILDLDVDGRTPLSEDGSEGFFTRLQYVDPNLFGSQRFYLIGGFTKSKINILYNDDSFWDNDSTSADLALGFRVKESLHFSLTYRQRVL